jgi:thioredoxin-dependent peroxiredoxin
MKIKAFLLAIITFLAGCSRQNKLKVGVVAPEFSLHDQQGALYTLSALRGRKLALCFYPKDNTPGCTSQVCSLRDGWEQLKAADITVLGVNFDSEKTHRNFVREHALPFPLLSDEDWSVSKAYGAKTAFIPLPKRVTFLIDESGHIAHIIENVDVKNHAQQILDAWQV